MLANAILKIKNEMEQYKNDPFIKIVGEFLIQYVETNPEAADKIMNAEKTIAKSIDNMAKAASKKKVGNRAALSDQEGYETVLKYFDISLEGNTSTVEAKTNSSACFDIKLEDLL